MGSPVFIVGAPRSGTTLLAAILNAHSQFACGPETQFLSKLKGEFQSVDEAMTFAESLTINQQPVLDVFGLTPTDLREFLADRHSAAWVLEGIAGYPARSQGKPR